MYITTAHFLRLAMRLVMNVTESKHMSSRLLVTFQPS